MSSTCIKKHFPTLEARYEALVSLPMGEKEAAIKATIEEYERLQGELNDFKKTIGVEEETYTPLDNAKAIQAIEEQYNKLIENVAPLVKKVKTAEVPIVKEDTRQKEIDKINKEYDTKINALKPQETDPIKKLEEKIKYLMNNPYNLQYVGDSLTQVRPNPNDVAEYESLLNKWNRRAESKLSRILERPSDYNYKDLGLSEQEIDRFKELNKTLGIWMTFQATSAGENESVADLLERLEALKLRAQVKEVLVTLKDEDYTLISQESEEELLASKDNNQRGGMIPVQFLRTPINNSYKWSHGSAKQFLSFFPNKIKEFIQTYLGFAITLNSGETINATFNDRGGFDTLKKEWDEISGESNVLIKNFGTNASAINQSIGFDTDGNEQFSILNGDASYPQTDGTNLVIDVDTANKIKSDDVIDLYVSTTDKYNADAEILRVKENKSEDEKKQLAKMDAGYHIYLFKEGKLIGSVPASYIEESNKGIGLPLFELRKNAKKYIEKRIKEGKSGLIPLTQKLEVNLVFLGQPSLSMQRDENGSTTTKNNPFTAESIQLVVGTGYIQNGIMTSEVNIDAKQFITKVSKENKDKKIPFIVFTHNNKLIAFPVSLTQTPNDKSLEVIKILNDPKVSNSDKIKAFVDALNENGIDTNVFGINYTDSENFTSQPQLQNALDILSEVKDTVDIEEFAKKQYKKDRLIDDAVIAINLEKEPFLTPKILIRISDKVTNTTVNLKDQKEELKQQETDSINTLAEYTKAITSDLLDSKNSKIYENLENTDLGQIYSDALASDFNIELGQTTFIQNQTIVKALGQAVSTTALDDTINIKFPKLVKDRLGSDLVGKITMELKNLDKVKEQLKAMTAEIKDATLKKQALTKTMCK